MGTPRSRSARAGALATLATTVALAATVGMMPAGAKVHDDDTSHGNEKQEHQVTLCHATASVTNPYVRITVDFHSVIDDHGHGGHSGPVFDTNLPKHTAWGDIIPPFTFGTDVYGGMNWDASGQALLAGDCTEQPTTTTTPPTTAPPTTAPPTTAPPTTAPPTTTTPTTTTPTTTTPTTTQPGPTTTVPEETTTTMPVSTTTVPEEPTTTVAEETTTTVAGETTTTAVAAVVGGETVGGDPAAGAPAAVAQVLGVSVTRPTTTATGQLPVTGSSPLLPLVGLSLLVGGLVVLAGSRRRVAA